MDASKTTNSMEVDEKKDPYGWDDQVGWRRYRLLRPGREMYYDVKRRLPYYWSDIADGFTYRVAAATVRMYFVNLLPALAFELDMSRRTNGFYGVNEALFSSALAAIVFSTLSAQPLTIVGITGLISLFNYTIYDIIAEHDATLYPQFMVWVGIWTAVTHWITSFGNLCDYMRFITDFSSNSFAMYVGIIYIIKGVELLVALFEEDGPVGGYYAVMVAILFTGTIYALEAIGSSVWFSPLLRSVLADYAYPIATIFWTGFTHIPGRLENASISRLPHNRAFHPTVERSWLIPFWNLPVKWVFVALPIGILVTLLFYYDHNVSSLTAEAKQFPLKKPAGFHWDFFLLGVTSFVAGILGLPLPNGLVPQAPVHTDACTDYRDELKIIHTDDPLDDEIHAKLTVAVSVAEQRISHFVMGLAIIGTMTGPLLVVLHTIPQALFAGVFFIVGWGSIAGNSITASMIFLIREDRYIEPSNTLLGIRKRQILHFISWQWLGVAATVAISQTIGAIGFPVLIIALIPLRWIVLPRLFSVRELEVMDALTADNPAVLVSLGGKPKLPEKVLAEKRGIHVEEGEANQADSDETAIEVVDDLLPIPMASSSPTALRRVSISPSAMRRASTREIGSGGGLRRTSTQGSSGLMRMSTGQSGDGLRRVSTRESERERIRQGLKSAKRQRVGSIHR